MTKEDTMARWAALKPDQPMLKHMTAIPYKSKGSTYGCCGIRIDGNPEFIDAVMSHLKELLKGEDVTTRLQLARNKVDGTKLGKSFDNRDSQAECVYIRLCQRGGEGVILQSILKAHERKNEEEYLD